MVRTSARFLTTLLASLVASASAEESGWIDLFNGQDLSGWRAVENPDTWRVEGGHLVAHGDRSHLFYVGDVGGADFKDFEWECEVLLKPRANSGMYFHTAVQEEGWPDKGYEAQLNNTHGDRKKTGGLYDVADVLDDSPATDNEWFTQRVVVRGMTIEVYVNDKLVTTYTEPEDEAQKPERVGRRLSSGTVALQGHDPGSEMHFRRVRIKLLD